MTTLRKTTLSLVILLLASTPFALAQGTYTQIDFPGAIQTVVVGINTAGSLVGTYEDSAATWHGFLLSQGTFTTIDYPGSAATYVYGINDVGQIVGSTGLIGFLYDQVAQTFTTISFPNQNASTTPYGINNSGTIVGAVQVNSNGGVFDVGFELVSGAYHLVRAPGVRNAALAGINNSGLAAGYGFGNGLRHVNLTFDQGRFQRVLPLAQTVYGINDAGAMVGSFVQPKGSTAGFVYQDGAFQFLVFPGEVTGTVAFSINNDGVVAGWFVDASELKNHGFTWTPPAAAEKK